MKLQEGGVRGDWRVYCISSILSPPTFHFLLKGKMVNGFGDQYQQVWSDPFSPLCLDCVFVGCLLRSFSHGLG